MLLRFGPSRYRTIKWMLFLTTVGSIVLFFGSYFSYLHQQGPQMQRLRTEPFHIIDGNLDYDNKNGVTKASSEKPQDKCSNVSLALRIDCHPDFGANKHRCLSRGCCWQPHMGAGIPPCYVPFSYLGYKQVSKEATAYGLYLTLLRSMPSGFPGDSLRVNVEVGKYDTDTVRIRITDRDAVRYEPPVPIIPNRKDSNPARFQVYLTDDCAVLIRAENITFGLRLNSLVFSEFFNQLAVQLPATIIYGLRSENESFFTSLRRSRHVFFADGKETVTFDVENEVPIFYGGHPFLVLLHEPTNLASGIFLFNSNHLEVQLTEAATATFRTTGGILDFFIFLGPTVASVVGQYQTLVGFPGLPPTSLLRHHWEEQQAYRSLDEYISTETIAEAHNRMSLSKKGWNISIDHKIVVQNKDGRPARCLAADANTRYLIDFTHPATTYFWMEVLDITRLFTFKSPYRTIDLQAPSCHVVGRDCRILRQMPYLPPGVSRDVSDMLCPTNVLHYSTYGNLQHAYSYLQAKTTVEALVGLQRKRQGILSDRTFPGQGKWSGYWVRHPKPTWKRLDTSFGDMLRYSMYGIPLFGANLCNLNATRERGERLLCVAWLGLATFFPIFRREASSQNETVPADSFYRDAISLRDFLHPYLYTLLYRSSQYGEMVARPMAFEFQQDPKTHRLQQQFMWGTALLVVPKMLEQSGNQLDVYFPSGTWFDWHTGKRIDSKGQRMFVPVPLENKPGMFLRGSSILPGEGGSFKDRNSSIHIVIAPDNGDYASGNMYIDDGSTLYTVERKDCSHLNFFYMKNVVTGHCSPCKQRMLAVLTKVTVFGVLSKPRSVSFNSRNVQFVMAGTTMYVTQVKHKLTNPFTLIWQ